MKLNSLLHLPLRFELTFVIRARRLFISRRTVASIASINQSSSVQQESINLAISTMPFLRTLILLVFALAFLTVSTTSRDLPPLHGAAASDLEARLLAAAGYFGEDGGGIMDCWNALLELRSCSSEIVLFFINGESYIGLDCCRAIRVITRHCWTNMLSSLGFTTEESEILRGYCDAETAAVSPPQPPPLPFTPAAAPAVPVDDLID